MATETTICNMALSYLGRGPITNLLSPTDATEQLCATNYEPARDAVMESQNWTFAVARATLSTPLAGAPEWGMSYYHALPNDCLRVVWAGRNQDEQEYDTFDWRVESEGIATNEQVIYIRYIKRVTDPGKFSPLFVQALAARLAVEMCIAVTQNVSLYDRLANLYALKVGEAATNNGLQGRSQVIKQNSLQRGR